MSEMHAESPVVYLVDDDESLRIALGRVLRAGGHEVQVFASVVDFLLARQEGLRGCLLLDVRMPGGPSGLELQKALTRQGETIPIIFLTGHGDIPMSVQAIKNGAFDFLTKPVDPDVLLESVKAAIASQETSLRLSLAKRTLAERMKKLSADELEIFRRVVNGQLNKQIAGDLGCSERTVKARRSQVMIKMGAASLAELVHMADELQRMEG